MDIKEMRILTGLTQKEFALKYDIPLGTLRRWEYGESKPAPYLLKLIALQLPTPMAELEKIDGTNGRSYFYDKNKKIIIDNMGTYIKIKEDISGVNKDNLILYLNDLFDSYYAIVDKFNLDCKYDKIENIVWS